jgi:hypothetical protein
MGIMSHVTTIRDAILTSLWKATQDPDTVERFASTVLIAFRAHYLDAMRATLKGRENEYQLSSTLNSNAYMKQRVFRSRLEFINDVLCYAHLGRMTCVSKQPLAVAELDMQNAAKTTRFDNLWNIPRNDVGPSAKRQRRYTESQAVLQPTDRQQSTPLASASGSSNVASI